jgi:predicted kinase
LKAPLIILSGLPGTGKSAIADALGRARGMPVISVDPIESAILRSGLTRSFETGLAAYLVAEALADGFTATGVGAVIDAVNSTEYAREQWRKVAVRHDADMRVIVCLVSDLSIHEARLAGRDRGMTSGEPSPEDVERRRNEWTDWPEPHLTLDAVDDLDANVARALQFIA